MATPAALAAVALLALPVVAVATPHEHEQHAPVLLRDFGYLNAGVAVNGSSTRTYPQCTLADVEGQLAVHAARCGILPRVILVSPCGTG